MENYDLLSIIKKNLKKSFKENSNNKINDFEIVNKKLVEKYNFLYKKNRFVEILATRLNLKIVLLVK
ncbi:hypothetical protein [Blattabacterium cuenoti]|uniref:hypothetical protein n=1 Tax=Blattabacterium cuenoti TaxID=1653831 RepID=UPI00163D2B9E|nr:hypothetical protein [Blattabacterium cuenoti]